MAGFRAGLTCHSILWLCARTSVGGEMLPSLSPLEPHWSFHSGTHSSSCSHFLLSPWGPGNDWPLVLSP